MEIIHLKTDYSDGLVDKVCSVLEKGGVVVFPTDTVYGLLVDATNENAVKKLISCKNRPPGKPISIFVPSLEVARSYVSISNDHAKVIQPLIPGPFTFVFPSLHKVSLLLESERKTLGIRMPKFLPVQTLVLRYGKPLTATSANLAGHPSHHSVQAFLSELSEEKTKCINLVVDGGTLVRNRPSTVVDFSEPDIRILRTGDLSFSKREVVKSKSALQTQRLAQQLFVKHSSALPEKPLVFLLRGQMGSGKTVFAKGLGEALCIRNIVSPTYVMYYEYKANKKPARLLVHADFFNLEEEAELKHLGLDEYFIPGTVFCIEWGDRAGGLVETMRRKAKVIDIEINNTGKSTREIIIHTP